MRPARLLFSVLLGSAFAFDALLAADASTPESPGSLSAARAACGGAPIQDGHAVQPTPARDKCLAEKLHVPPPKPLKPEAKGTYPDEPVPAPEMRQPQGASKR